MVQSNYVARLDVRTDEKCKQDIIGGSIREDNIIERLICVHNKKYSSLFKIQKINRLTKHVMFKGHYIDRGDFSIVIEKDGKQYEKIIEIEHLNKEGRRFRFKKQKIERCIRDNIGILYAHNPNIPDSHIRCFSVKELKTILNSFKFLSLKFIFGGKSHCTFEYDMYDDWVTLDNLNPKNTYIKHMKKILLPDR
jgi:hypothetical protein